MKKIIAFCIAVVMLFAMALPVSAADTTELTTTEVNEIYQAYLKNRYEKTALSEKYSSFEAFAEKTPITELDLFEFYGRYGENQSYVVCICTSGSGFGNVNRFVGDYYFQFGTYAILGNVYDGVFVYDPVQQTFDLLSKAYEDGSITDADMQAMNESGRTDDRMRLIGDLDQNKKLDVADIVSMKEEIIALSDNDFSVATDRHYADFDQSGYVDVGDIVALKNHIMSN